MKDENLGNKSAPAPDAVTTSPISKLLPRHVQSVWDQLPTAQQAEMLSFDLRLLYARANYVDDPSNATEALTATAESLHSGTSARQWRWKPESPQARIFDTAEAFRSYVEKAIPADLRVNLKHPRLTESSVWATQALHDCIKMILDKVQAHKGKQQEQRIEIWRLPRHCQVLEIIWQEVHTGHEYLLNALAAPICRALEHACPELPEHFAAFESEDFCGLPFIAMELHVEAAIIKQITEWVEWQLASICRLTDPEGVKQGNALEPFTLSSDEAGEKLTLTDTTKHQLLQQDSIAQWFWSAASTPGKAKPASKSGEAESGADTGSDPAVDESDADLTESDIAESSALRKGIDAQPPIWRQPPRLPGPASKQAARAFDQLKSFLENVKYLAENLEKVEASMTNIITCRKLMKDWAKSMNLKHNPGNAAQQVHPSCMLCMLRQERSIAQAKLCQNAHQFGKLWRETFNLNQESAQLEAAQVHCTLAMAEINTHKCALREDDARAAMHQQWIAMQLAGEALDEETQLYADMIWTYSDIQKEQAVFKAEQEVVKEKEEAVKAAVEKNNVQQESLTAWSNKVDTMGDAVERIMRSAKISDSVLSLTKWRGTQNKELKALNRQFHKEVWPKLCAPAQDKALYTKLQAQHKEMMRHFEEGCARLQPLLALYTEAACHDPAAQVLPQVVLPLLKERLQVHATPALASNMDKLSLASQSGAKWDPAFAKVASQFTSQAIDIAMAGSAKTLGLVTAQRSLLQSLKRACENGLQHAWWRVAFADDCFLGRQDRDVSDGMQEFAEITLLTNLTPESVCLATLCCFSV